MIKPTPGRIVWFKRGDTRPGEELAAIICKVINDRLVNLAVFDVHGHSMSRISVRLLQDDERPDALCLSWCEWMPYQKGQAAPRGPLMCVGADGNLHYVDAMPASPQEAAADAAALDVSALDRPGPPCGGAVGSALARLPAGTPIAEGFTESGPDEPIGQASRPWEPRQSASMLPHLHRQRGSTGQLFEVRNGQWVRVIENPPRPA